MSPSKCFWVVGLCILVLVFLASPWGCQRSEPTPDSPQAAAKPATEPEVEPEKEAAHEGEAEPTVEPAAAIDESLGQLQKVPLGLPPVPVPQDNPITPEKIALGKMLYFDKRLSKNGTISCATCHDPKTAWTEHRATSEGIGGQVGGANSPTVINAAYATAQFWDGRAASLEEQALGPIENPIEMGHKMDVMVGDLTKIPEYREAFKKAFDAEPSKEGIAKAIASFERTVLSGNSPYDRFKAGQKDALNESQQRGLEVFEDVGCANCHTPPLMSNYRYYNAGVGMDKEKPDQGRKSVTGKDSDLGKFRVPTLREVANTGPYFHDGSVETLEEAVGLMADGGKDNANLSGMVKSLRQKEISEQDRKDLVEFLKALSGDYPGKED